jgi:hypothetical protein
VRPHTWFTDPSWRVKVPAERGRFAPPCTNRARSQNQGSNANSNADGFHVDFFAAVTVQRPASGGSQLQQFTTAIGRSAFEARYGAILVVTAERAENRRIEHSPRRRFRTEIVYCDERVLGTRKLDRPFVR